MKRASMKCRSARMFRSGVLSLPDGAVATGPIWLFVSLLWRFFSLDEIGDLKVKK